MTTFSFPFVRGAHPRIAAHISPSPSPGGSERTGSVSPLSWPRRTEHRDRAALVSGSVVATPRGFRIRPSKGVRHVTPFHVWPNASRASGPGGPEDRAPVMATVAVIVPLELIRRRKERDMANNPRLADLAVTEVMETQMETQRLLRLIDDALADGEVTPEEARAIRQQAEEVKREADEDVLAAERTNVGELITAAGLTGRLSPRLTKLAEDVGLVIHVPALNVVHIEDYRQSNSIA